MKKYYLSQIGEHTTNLKREKFKRNIVTTLKVTSFLLIIYMLYLLISADFNYSIHMMVAMVLSLIILSIIDTRIVEKINIYTNLLTLLNTEIDYLDGNFSALPSGSEYSSAAHSYSIDLDIFGQDSLYQAINRTVTKGGSDLLSHNLLTPCTDEKEIIERQEAAQELKQHMEWGHLFRATGALHKTISNSKVIDVWKELNPFVKNRVMLYVIYAANAVAITSWILAIFEIIPYNLPRTLSLLQLIVSIFLAKRMAKQHRTLDNFVKAIGNYFYLVKLVDNEQFSSRRLVQLKSRLLGKDSASIAFKSLNRILDQLDQRFSLVSIILDAVYMKNVHHMIALDRWKERYSGQVHQWVDVINEFDLYISMSNYSCNHPDFTTPTIDNSVIISGKEMCHPLLRSVHKVSNDFEVKTLHSIFIITGANMAGKSTFLRSVGVNYVLASSGNVVCSSDFRFTPMAIFTSMRTTDNLSKGTSYFHAELLRLKELIIMASKGEPIFIILDEMLKGTNSADKLNGSIKFLINLLKFPVSGLVATHDLALGELSDSFSDNFHNVCFEITHEGQDIVYDYKLKKGVSQNMNASILLEQMGLI